MAASHCTLAHYDSEVDNITWEQTVWSSFILNRIQPGRKGHVILHFLFKNACYTLNNNPDGSEMTDVIKQVSYASVIPVNKGRSPEQDDVKSPVCSVYSMCLYSCVCVCRKGAPSDAQGQFGITQCRAKAIWQSWGGAGTSRVVWDKAGQDRMERGRAGQWRVRQQETAMPSQCTPFRWHICFYTHSISKQV